MSEMLAQRIFYKCVTYKTSVFASNNKHNLFSTVVSDHEIDFNS